MQVEFAPSHLRCPACRRDRTLRLRSDECDQREVREGALVCTGCGVELAVRRGVAHTMLDAPEHVRREAAGLERFADYMRSHGWNRSTVRSLPDVYDGYWFVQRVSIDQLHETVSFREGEWLLDVGSNTCWASNHFAVRGLHVIALDIATTELQGLYTADYFIDDDTSYFERVLGSMNAMPIASASLDYVYCCEVLHHNDTAGLRLAFEEAFRVLKPGGKLLVLNETLKTLRDPIGVHNEAVAEFDGHEHAHWAARYRWEAIRAGFATELLEPRYHEFFTDVLPAKPPAKSWRRRIRHELRSRRRLRRAYLHWTLNVVGGVQFGMIASKPAEDRTVAQPVLAAATRGLRDPRPPAAPPG